MDKYEIVIIGAGTAGCEAAKLAGKMGIKTAIIERTKIGEGRANFGYTRRKYLLEIAEQIKMIKNAWQLGFNQSHGPLDLKKILTELDQFCLYQSQAIAAELQSLNVSIFQGSGYIQDRNTVLLLDNNRKIIKKIGASNIIIASGIKPKSFDHFNLDSNKSVWTPREALMLKSIPSKLAILGSDMVSIELADIYSSFGSNVTIIEQQEDLSFAADIEIRRMSEAIFKKKGLNFITKATIQNISKNPNGLIVLELMQNREIIRIETQKLLLSMEATKIEDEGDLGLTNTSIRTYKDHVIVNEFMQTNDHNIYAIGDIVGPPYLANKALHEATLCVKKMANLPYCQLNLNLMPKVIFTSPQIASFGLTEYEALEKGYKVSVGRDSCMDDQNRLYPNKEGLIKLIFNAQTSELLGAHMVGQGASELITLCAVLKSCEGLRDNLSKQLFPYLSLSQAIQRAVLDSYYQK